MVVHDLPITANSTPRTPSALGQAGPCSQMLVPRVRGEPPCFKLRKLKHSEALSSDYIFVSRAQGLLGLLPLPLAYTPPTQLQQPSAMGMCYLSLTGYAATLPDRFPSPLQGSPPGFFWVSPRSAYNLDKDFATSSQGSQSGLPTRLLLSPHARRLLGTVLGQLFTWKQWVWPWLLPLVWPESCLYPNSQHLFPHFRYR